MVLQAAEATPCPTTVEAARERAAVHTSTKVLPTAVPVGAATAGGVRSASIHTPLNSKLEPPAGRPSGDPPRPTAVVETGKMDTYFIFCHGHTVECILRSVCLTAVLYCIYLPNCLRLLFACTVSALHVIPSAGTI